MLESILYFILFFAVGVFLPIMAVWVLVRIWLHFFGKDRTGKRDRKAEDRIAGQNAEIYGTAETDEERRAADYFLRHSEEAYPDSEFLPRMRGMRAEMRRRRIEKPGMEKILDYEERVVADGRCLMRRLPNAELVSSKYRRTLIFFSPDSIAVEMLDLDLISLTVKESEMLIPTSRVLEVEAPKWTPPVHVDDHLERGTSWSLKFLLTGGTTKTVKGFPDDSSEVAEELTRRVRELSGRA